MVNRSRTAAIDAVADDPVPADPVRADPVPMVILADDSPHAPRGRIVRLDPDAADRLEIEGAARRATDTDLALAPVN